MKYNCLAWILVPVFSVYVSYVSAASHSKESNPPSFMVGETNHLLLVSQTASKSKKKVTRKRKVKKSGQSETRKSRTKRVSRLNSSSGKKIGLGIVGGSPTGLTSSYRLSRNSTIDSALSYSRNKRNRLYFHMAHHWHFRNVLELDKVKFGWYGGVGGRFRNKVKTGTSDVTEVAVGPRGSVGFHFPVMDHRFDVFGEFAVIPEIFPDLIIDADLSIGGRVFF